MAKTKLMIKLELALNSLEVELEDLADDDLGTILPAVGEKKQRVQARFMEAMTAVDALRTHLKNLDRRMNTPTVADRLRNLKNVFKDKVELNKKRKDVGEQFDNMADQIEKARDQSLVCLCRVEAIYKTVVLSRSARAASTDSDNGFGGMAQANGSAGSWHGSLSGPQLEQFFKMYWDEPEAAKLKNSKTLEDLHGLVSSIEQSSAARLSSFHGFLNSNESMKGWTPSSPSTTALTNSLKKSGFTDSQINEMLKSKNWSEMQNWLTESQRAHVLRKAKAEKLMKSYQ